MNLSHPSQYFSLVVNIVKKRHFAHIHKNMHTRTLTILLSLLECGFYTQDVKLCHYALDSLLGASHLNKGLSLSVLSLQAVIKANKFCLGLVPTEISPILFQQISLYCHYLCLVWTIICRGNMGVVSFLGDTILYIWLV